MKRRIDTFEEFEKVYYPLGYEKERTDLMTPEELGSYMAQKTLDKIKRAWYSV